MTLPSYLSLLRSITLVVQALSSYEHVPEQDDAVFVFLFHWVLPGVDVGDVVRGYFGWCLMEALVIAGVLWMVLCEGTLCALPIVVASLLIHYGDG